MKMRTIKIYDEVYVPMIEHGGFKLVKGIVMGCRPFSTSSSNFIYYVETPFGQCQLLPSEIFESVEDFKNKLENFVIE